MHAINICCLEKTTTILQYAREIANIKQITIYMLTECVSDIKTRAQPIYCFANFIGRYEPVADISVSANMPPILTFFYRTYRPFPE